MPYDITKIPGIMRKKGWNKGAALMDGWFGRPTNDKPEQGQHDRTTISMSWALGFKRAKEVYEAMFSERVWANAAAKRAIVKMLREQGKLAGQDVMFGRTYDVAVLDRNYVQYRAVGSYLSDEYDDMLAALGRFVFRAAVGGRVLPWNGGHRIMIDEVAVYIRDSYDFNGEQSLGVWSDDDFIGGWSVVSGYSVSNKSFRDWRAANGRGGDYLVFSDARITRLGTPDVFDV